MSWKEHVYFMVDPDKWLNQQLWEAFEAGDPRAVAEEPSVPGKWDADEILTAYAGQIISRRGPHMPARKRSRKRESSSVMCLIQTDPKCFILIEGGSHTRDVKVIADSWDRADALMGSLVERFWKANRMRRHAPKFSVLCTGQGGLDSIEVHVEKPFIRKETGLGLYYGESFLEKHAELIKQMKSWRSGVVLLEGPPGTGKTTYLRGCMHWLRRSHHFLTIPLHEFDHLTSSQGTRFLLGLKEQYPNQSLGLIVEDAEQLITGDGNDRNPQIATLLNLGDGLLGEHLNLQILLSFNCELTRIDPALTRLGRLMWHHRFDPLTTRQAIQLAAHEGFSIDAEHQDEWPLGDIFHHQKNKPRPRQNHKVVGFAPDIQEDVPF